MPPAPLDAKHTLPHSLTPQMRYVLERIVKAGRPALQTLPPVAAREAYEAAKRLQRLFAVASDLDGGATGFQNVGHRIDVANIVLNNQVPDSAS